MLKLIFFFFTPLLILGLFFYQGKGKKTLSSEEELYQQIGDIHHPSNDDYFLIQTYLEKGHRPLLDNLKDYETRLREFKLIGKRPDETPQFGRAFVNCSEEDRENCLILYASYNKNYPQALKRLLDSVMHSDYKGHVLYRIGGWPNTEEGDLTLTGVPYAFKPCFFKEAQKLGYQRVLWLDTSVTPLVSLNEQFCWIKQKGYLVVGNTHTVGPFFNELSARSLKTTLEESFAIPSVSAGIFGLDFSHEQARKALSLWYEAAKDPYAFFSARSDQNALSIILHQLEMTDWIAYDRIAEGKQKVSPSSIYLLDRKLAHKRERTKKQTRL